IVALRLANRIAEPVKLAEASRLESEAKVHRLYESMVEAVGQTDMSGRLIEFNPAFEAMLGYTGDELRRLGYQDLTPRQWHAVDERVLAEQILPRGYSDTYEKEYRRKDGTVFPIELRVYLVRDAVGKPAGLWGIIQDITERRQAQASLEKASAYNRSLIEASLDALVTIGPNGKITDVNRATETLTGLTRQELIGSDFSEYFTDPAAARAGYQTVFREGSVKDYPLEMHHRDGRTTPVLYNATVYRSPSGEIIGVFAAARDVTELKHAQAVIEEAYATEALLNALRKRSLAPGRLEEKLSDQLALLVRAPWMSLEPEAVISILNASGKSMVLAARHGSDPAQSAAYGEPTLDACLGAQGQDSRDRRVVIPILAAERALGCVSLLPKRGAGLTAKQRNLLAAAAGIFAAEIVQARTEEQLAQVQKMESVGRLAGGVAHDFNNLLTAITGDAEFVLQRLPKEDPKRKVMEDILLACRRAATLTRQLLAFSRKQILNPQVVDLNASVADSVKLLRRLVGEETRLVTRFAAAPCRVKIDVGQMDQVLMNLVVNARDAMPKGGIVTIATETTGPHIWLRVSDTGEGMDEATLSRLFEPFFTTKEPGKGTGLGLSTVYGIVKQSGGDIQVESSPGKGTTFSIVLPRAETGKPAKAGRPKSSAIGGRETVLVAEDEESVRRIVLRALEGRGYTVLAAANGAAALKLLEGHGGTVELLLTDVVMPGMNGRELACEVTRRCPGVRTLYMSGYTDDAVVRHGVLEPGLAFIYKPFDAEVLAAKVRETLDGPPEARA
ncbi:MAG: PAS domain S-box protein, partial [Elusimicrobia bacterium]|nr:PAS domain S-box protein [Elusimicrobiota bacterium]